MEESADSPASDTAPEEDESAEPENETNFDTSETFDVDDLDVDAVDMSDPLDDSEVDGDGFVMEEAEFRESTGARIRRFFSSSFGKQE